MCPVRGHKIHALDLRAHRRRPDRHAPLGTAGHPHCTRRWPTAVSVVCIRRTCIPARLASFSCPCRACPESGPDTTACTGRRACRRGWDSLGSRVGPTRPSATRRPRCWRLKDVLDGCTAALLGCMGSALSRACAMPTNCSARTSIITGSGAMIRLKFQTLSKSKTDTREQFPFVFLCPSLPSRPQ